MDNKENVIKRFQNKLNKKQKIIITVIFITAVFLLISKNPKETKTNEETKEELSTTENYVKKLETSLKEIICEITGERDIKIMITAQNSAEKVYATQTEKNGEKIGEEYVIIKNSSQSQNAVILKEIEPEIKGAVVVTGKADNFVIKEQIIEAVKTVLGINASKVSVVSKYSNKSNN